MTVRITQTLIYSLLTAQLAGCTVGPDYVRPEATIPNEFKESQRLETGPAPRQCAVRQMVGNFQRSPA